MNTFYLFFRKFTLDGILSFTLLMHSLIILCGIKNKTGNCKLSSFLLITASTAVYIAIYLTTKLIWKYEEYWYYFIFLILVSEIFSYFFIDGSLTTKTIYILFFVSLVILYKQICSPLYSNEGIIPDNIYALCDISATLLMFVLFGSFTFLLKKMRFTNSIKPVPMNTALLFYFPVSILAGLIFEVTFVPKEYYASITALIILSNFPVICKIFSILIKTYEEQRYLDAALTQSLAELSSFKIDAIQKDLIRQERHELKNNYFYIQTLLKEKKYTEAESFINKMIGDFELNLSSIETGNTFLDYLINKKVSYAKHNSINTICQVYVPKGIVLDNISLCTILSNLLDNAIEYSIGKEKAEIKILIHVAQNYLVCKIENRVDTNDLKNNPDFKTTKKDALSHGYGLKIIESTINKINGIYSTEYLNGYFSAQVMIPLLNESN